MSRLSVPTSGVFDRAAFVDTPANTCPPDAMRNMWPSSPDGGRGGMAQRAGLSRVVARRLGTSAKHVQGLIVVDRASAISGFDVGNCERITAARSIECDDIVNPADTDFLRFNAWILDPNLGVRAGLNERGQADPTWSADAAVNSGLGGKPCFSCCWSPDGRLGYVLSLFPLVATGEIIFSVSRFNTNGELDLSFGTGMGLAGYVVWGDWDPTGGSPSDDIFPNAIAASDEYVFVATTKGYVYVLSAADGTPLQRFDMDGWAEEVAGVGVRPDGRLVAAFNGSMAGAASPRNNWWYWRAGVMLMDVAGGIDAPGDVLSARQYGAKLAASDADYEDHPYFRIAEKSQSVPRFGATINALAVGVDGSVAFARTNRGWARLDSNPPSNSQRRVTVGLISAGEATASLLWEQDTASIRESESFSEGGTIDSDVPLTPNLVNTPDDPHPSIDAICRDPLGHVYCAGRKLDPAHPNQVFKLRVSDGAIMWRAFVSDAADHWINQGGIAYSAADGTIVVAGKRKNGTSDVSHLWKLNADTGAVVGEHSTGHSVDAYQCAVNPDGLILYVAGKEALA